ncbi:MAG: glycosyltransferase family 39 protein [Acetatifactor sp.]|nr:glycosyltransferase family 39 protein [Acetatifactor sp.]
MMKINDIAAIVIWVFYGLVTGCCVFLVAMSAGVGLGHSFLPGFVVGMAILLLLGPFSFFLHKGAQKLFPAVDAGRRMQFMVAESLLLIACLAGMTVLRIMSVWNVETDPVFEMAKVTAEGFSPAVAHQGAELYLYLLHGAMLLVGNKASAAVFLQSLLAVCAAVSLYLGIRRLSGPVAALISIVFLGFAPYMLEETKRLTPLLLFLIFYGAALYCIGAIFHRMDDGQRGNRIYTLLYYLAAGLLTGFCFYLDVAGITLLIFLTGVICFGMRYSENGENGVLAFLCCLASAVLGYVGAHGIRSLGGGSLTASIYGQWELYLPGDFRIPATVASGGTSWDVPVLVILMAVGVYGFWFSRKIRDKGMWLFAAVLLMGMQCFGISNTTYFDGYGLLYLFCAAMAGCSVADLVVLKGENAEMEEMDMTGVPDEMEMISVDTNSSTDAANEIHYIENPLPLPKKKAHRVLDYDYEVADDDDFDIQ